MALHHDLDLKDRKPIFLKDTLSYDDASPHQGSAVQKTLSGRTFIDILKFCCDLDLEHSNQISSYETLAFDNVPSNQI